MSRYNLDIEVETEVRMEGSWGASPWEKTTLRITAWANMDKLRGGFEIYDTDGGDRWYAEGGLWFTQNGELADYDGVGNLDYRIRQWIKNGFTDEGLIE